MIFSKGCECLAGYCNSEGCNLCDIQFCYYNFFGLKISEVSLFLGVIIFSFVSLIILISLIKYLKIKKKW